MELRSSGVKHLASGDAECESKLRQVYWSSDACKSEKGTENDEYFSLHKLTGDTQCFSLQALNIFSLANASAANRTGAKPQL